MSYFGGGVELLGAVVVIAGGAVVVVETEAELCPATKATTATIIK